MSDYFNFWCKTCDIKNMKYMALASNFLFEMLVVPRAIFSRVCPLHMPLHCFSGTSTIT